jgi:putative flippase GtrA
MPVERASFGGLARRIPPELVRYGLVQVGVIGAEYAAYLGLEEGLGVPAVAAHFAARALAGVLAYLAHAYYTFRGDHSHARSAPRYVALLVINALFSGALLGLLLQVAGPILGKVLADTAAFGFNYVVSRRFVFGRRPGAAPPRREER